SAQQTSIGADPLTANRYSYVNGDPVNLVDPTGHNAYDQCRGTSCEGPDAAMRHGDYAFRHGADPWTATGYQITYFDVAKRPGQGQVMINLFIAEAAAGPPGAASRGDNRGHGPQYTCLDDRVCAIIDYETGRGYVRINRSCSPDLKSCADALPIVRDSPYPAFYERTNHVKVTTVGGGDLLIDLSVVNAHAFIAPAIDDTFFIDRTKSGSTVTVLSGNDFPARDAYQYKPGRAPVELLRRDESWLNVFALFF
ncbi:MAG TPA: hypothetical protein VG245_07095, partial [Candidatus Dormibacteraeota bacterium]|nr:hypothetical protein [Candidatus Dormibacteraeota bacterium]